MRFYTLYPSPVGPICITGDSDHILRLDFAVPAPEAVRRDDLPVLRQTCRWLDAYFAGQAPDPDMIPTRLEGSPFQKAVWTILQTIPYGQSLTYGTIAKQLSPTMSAQAVGGAVGKNPISILVPCHRVLGAGTRITGYAGGLDKKRYLLELEGIPYCE